MLRGWEALEVLAVQSAFEVSILQNYSFPVKMKT